MEEDAPVLAAGQAVSFGRDGFARPVRYADAKRIAAWHAERLEFDGIALADAVAEANRYTDTKLRVADPSIAGIEISGVFRVGDIAGFVAALNAAFGIRAVGGGSEILLMPPLKLTRGHADLQPGEAAAAD
jgi:transmembrane sensor